MIIPTQNTEMDNAIQKGHMLDKQKIKNIKYLVRQTEKKGEGIHHYYAYHEKAGWEQLSKGTIEVMKTDAEAKRVVDTALVVIEDYLPGKPSLILREAELTNQEHIRNLWKNPDMLYGKPPEEPVELPDIYKDFFYNFFNYKEDTERVLDWIAEGLEKKIQKFLYIVDIGGTGKGLMGAIISALHHKDNSRIISNEEISGRFNSYAYGKTFLCFDEPEVKDDKTKNKLKVFMNDTISVERKHQDAINADIFLNIMISGNNSDGIIMEAQQHDLRRYYCPEPRGVLLINRVENIVDYVSQLKDEDNIRKLYWFLKQREIKTDFVVSDSIIIGNNLLFEDLQSSASQLNPNLQTALINRRIAEINLKQVKANRYPVINLNSGYNFNQ